MTVAVGDICRATLEMQYKDLGAIQNVFHLRNVDTTLSDEEGLDDVVEILEDICVLLTLVIAALQVVSGVRVINVTQDSDLGFGQFVDDTPFTGTGNILPKQAAMGMNFYTSRLGVVGRKFWGAASIAVNEDAGSIAAASLAILGTAADDMSDQIVATNSIWEFGVIASLDAAWLPFTSYSLPTTMVTQRRRRTGVGI